MRTIPLFVVLLLILVTLPNVVFCLVEEQGSFKQFLMGREPGCAYDNWLSHISEGLALPGYNAYPPWDRQTNGFGRFCYPDVDQTRQWDEISTLFVNQDWAHLSDALINYSLPYVLVRFTDQDTGRIYYMLRENLAEFYDDNGTTTTADDESGSFNLGWGLFVFNPVSTSSVIISIPHPNDDYLAIPLGWKAFMTLNARYFFINGSGREVMWTNEGTYTNTKTLSDPSRNPEHPMHLTYMKSCNEIRTMLNNSNSIIKREFSMQTHSYDTNLHVGYSNCQISEGNGQTCLNLPIRDLSQTTQDIVNAAGYIIHPANSIGNNAEVTTSNFWCANYTYYPFVFNDGIHQTTVSNNIDLPGYGMNNQMLYSVDGWNNYDVYDPFFHIEMDELPDCYPQNDTTLAWFYGWNSASQSWNFNTRYDKAIAYYQPWVTALSTSLQSTLTMNDNHAPATPVINSISVINNSTLRMTWQRLYEYDFDSWCVNFQRKTYLGNGNYNIIDTLSFDRSQIITLADQASIQADLNVLPLGYYYSVWLTARDKSNRVSSPSNSYNFVIYGSPPLVSNLRFTRSLSDNNAITIEWTPVSGTTLINSYKVERRFRGATNWENVTNLPQTYGRYTDSRFPISDSLSYDYRVVTLGLSEQVFVPSTYCTGFFRVYPSPQISSISYFEPETINIQWQNVTTTLSGFSDTPDYYLVTKSSSSLFDAQDTNSFIVTANQLNDTYSPGSEWELNCYYKVQAMANVVASW